MSKELLQNQILKCQNGSKLYGTDTPTSDDDYLAVFVEPPEYLFSGRAAKSVSLHDRGPNERNFNAEVDGIAYPLRHFLKLALDGNPSILTVFFAQPEHVVFADWFGHDLLQARDLFLSKKAGPKFLGYMNSQLLRLRGEKKGHIPSRPELVERYGFDTKYAMQVARLAIQGLEFLTDGHISLPVSDEVRGTLLGIRNGELSFEDTLLYLSSLEDALSSFVAGGLSPLPDEPDYGGVYRLSQYIHEGFWRTGPVEGS